jgi:hypothetical protein
MHLLFREYRRLFAELLACRRNDVSCRPIVPKRLKHFANMALGNAECFAAFYDRIPGMPLMAEANDRVPPRNRGSVDSNKLLWIKLFDKSGKA